MTAGWRQKYAKNKVIRFEPAALEGVASWNPLDEIRLGTVYEVGDVQFMDDNRFTFKIMFLQQEQLFASSPLQLYLHPE